MALGTSGSTASLAGGAIVGAGIAGVGAALFAQRRGVQLPVYERGCDIQWGRHLLWIAPNGLELIAALGLLDQVRALAVPQQGMHFSTKHLRTLMTLDGPKLAKACGMPIVAIKRRDLWQLLIDAFVQGGGTILYDHELSGLSLPGQQDQGVSLSFRNRPASVEHAYVIGADGMGSAVRSAVFPGSSVVYQGIRTWLGQSRSPAAAAFVGRTVESWGQGTRFVLTSLDGQTVYWSALERSAHYEKNAADIPATLKDDLERLFADYHADVRSVLKDGDYRGVQRCNFGVVSGLKSYHCGPVALIGDAAHGMPPNMGQGASLGLEDALWVIHQLASGQTPAAAFRAYDRTRRPRVRAMVRLANSMNVLFQPKGKPASACRDLLAALVPDALTQRRMARLYRAHWPREV